jgi:hypothetical protein
MKEESYSLKFHIFDAIKNDGYPTYGTFHEDRLYVGYVDGPAIMISVTADYHTTVYSDSFTNTIHRYDCYEVGRTNIVIAVPNTNIAKGYITDFYDYRPTDNQRRSRTDIVQSTIQQFLLYIIYPIPKYHCACDVDTVQEIHEIMKSYYCNYYELLKPIGIMFENGDEEHVKKGIRMFVPKEHDFEYMFWPYLIVKYLIDNEHQEYIRYLTSDSGDETDIIDDLIEYCTKVDVNVVPYLIEYCERSTIQDRFKL